MPWLKSEGFATVINLRLADEKGINIQESRAAAEAAGLKYYHFPFNPKTADPAFVQQFMAEAGDELNQPLYLHCGSATRASALWMVSRVLQDGLSLEEAAKEGEAIAEKPEDAMAFSTAYFESQEK